MEDFDLILSGHPFAPCPIACSVCNKSESGSSPCMPAEKRSDFRPPHGHFSFVTFSHHHQKDDRNLAKSKKQHGKKNEFFFWGAKNGVSIWPISIWQKPGQVSQVPSLPEITPKPLATHLEARSRI
jgi:hypothetical protein